MEQDNCVFRDTQITEQFGCRHGQAVTRRGGPDVVCRSPSARARCSELYQRIKAVGLAALGVVDDPLQMPHSALLKIQFGGLLGIAELLDVGQDEIGDIDALLDEAAGRYGSVSAIPVDQLAGRIAAFRVRRGHRR